MNILYNKDGDTRGIRTMLCLITIFVSQRGFFLNCLGWISDSLNVYFMCSADCERRLLRDQDWEKDYNHRRRWCGPTSGEDYYRNTLCVQGVIRHRRLIQYVSFMTHVSMRHVPRLLPWRSKRPSSSTPTCLWQKQWLSGKQSLPLRSCSRKHRYVADRQSFDHRLLCFRVHALNT